MNQIEIQKNANSIRKIDFIEPNSDINYFVAQNTLIIALRKSFIIHNLLEMQRMKIAYSPFIHELLVNASHEIFLKIDWSEFCKTNNLYIDFASEQSFYNEYGLKNYIAARDYLALSEYLKRTVFKIFQLNDTELSSSSGNGSFLKGKIKPYYPYLFQLGYGEVLTYFRNMEKKILNNLKNHKFIPDNGNLHDFYKFLYEKLKNHKLDVPTLNKIQKFMKKDIEIFSKLYYYSNLIMFYKNKVAIFTKGDLLNADLNYNFTKTYSELNQKVIENYLNFFKIFEEIINKFVFISEFNEINIENLIMIYSILNFLNSFEFLSPPKRVKLVQEVLKNNEFPNFIKNSEEEIESYLSLLILPILKFDIENN